MNPMVWIVPLTMYQLLPNHSAFLNGQLSSHLSSCLLRSSGGAAHLSSRFFFFFMILTLKSLLEPELTQPVGQWNVAMPTLKNLPRFHEKTTNVLHLKLM